MKLVGIFFLAAFAAFAGTITVTVTPSLAPNAFGSPSYAAWAGNAVNGIRFGLNSYGSSGPAQYNAIANGTELDPSQVVVTGYNSWLGDADPAGTYGPAYANELGNRVHFGVDIWGHGNKIAIKDLSFVGASTDPADLLGFSWGAGSYNYSDQWVGIIYSGPWGVTTLVTSGANDQLVDRIVGRGSGNAFASYLTDPGATRQDKLDGVIAGVAGLGQFQFSGTYSIDGVSGTGFVVVGDAPEPATLSCLGGGLLLLGWALRKKPRQKI